jgi:hypothetical protein
MRPISVTLGPYAAGVATSVATAQTLTGSPPLSFAINGTLASGGAATLDNPRQVLITSAGNDSGVFFTVSGTGPSGPMSETVRGANAGAVLTNNLFKTVYAVSASNSTSSVTIGTASAPWYSPLIRLDEWANSQVGGQVVATGTVTYTIQTSFDEGPDSLVNPIPISSMVWDTSTAIGLPAAAGTATASFALTVTPVWIRLVLNATSTGSVRMTVTQYNVVNA